jgi:hypothetical protein
MCRHAWWRNLLFLKGIPEAPPAWGAAACKAHCLKFRFHSRFEHAAIANHRVTRNQCHSLVPSG